MNHEIDIRNVQASRRDIRGDEHGEAVITESLKRTLALSLSDVTVKDFRRDASTESRGELVSGALGLRKANRLFVLCVHGDEIHDDGRAVRVRHSARHEINRVRDALLVVTDEINHGVLRGQKLLGNLLDPARHGGGEEKRLSRLWAVLKNSFDILFKPNVEHLIRFIENDKFDITEEEAAALHEIHDAPRGSDDNVDASTKLPFLGADGRPAVHTQRVQRRRGEKDFILNLLGQLSRRREHDASRVSRCAASISQQPFNHRQRKRQRLPRTRSRPSDHVTTIQRRFQHRLLNRKQRIHTAFT